MERFSEITRAAMIEASARTGASMRAWHASAAHRSAAAVFAGCRSPEHAAERAESLLADADWAGSVLAPLTAAMAEDPFFEPALKFHRDARRVGVVLFDCPAVSIAASVASAEAMARLPPARTIVFTGRIAITRVVKAGGATLRRWVLPPGGARCAPADSMRLRDGAIHRTDGRTHAQTICDATSDVLTLVATIRAGAAPLMREYDRESCRLHRVADADDRPSRTAMLLRFLRVAGRADATACFADATRADDFHLRWAAMREWLALDASGAAVRLGEMATADPSQEVRDAAAQMLPVVRSRLAGALCRA